MSEAHRTPSSRPIKDRTGQRIGRLVVTCLSTYRTAKNIYWTCLCDCGAIKDIPVSNLLSGRVLSCGCLYREINGRRVTGQQEYWIYHAMLNRCYNIKSTRYKDYGGRGIRVCDRWLEAFANFLEDMGPRPSPKHSIDRFPDNNGDYTPINTRWASQLEQASNKRNSRLITHDGLTLPMAEWARRTGLSAACIHVRLKRGLSIDAALTPLTRQLK